MTKKKSHKEIERKFLLRRLPVELFKKKVEVLRITQYYFDIDGKGERFRIATNKDKGTTKYIHTIKTTLSVGVNDEQESSIKKTTFRKLYEQHKNNCRVIEKTRYVIKFEGLKFEIDEFCGFSLVMLEVELPKLTYKFDFPPGLEDEIIMEVTGIRQFNNSSLALKHEPGKLYFKQHK
jgi:CYTH domain-containing protein